MKNILVVLSLFFIVNIGFSQYSVTNANDGNANYIPKYLTPTSITNSLIFDNGTYVGIGTSSPLSKLSINGGLHVGGDSDAGDDNLLVDGIITSIKNVVIQGHYLGRGNLSAQPGNLAFGGGAMPNLNSSASTDHNVAIGQYALNANVSGAENFGLGYAALYNNTSGSQNVAIGSAVMLNYKNGSNNLAFGFHTLMGPAGAQNYGSKNIAIGTSTGLVANGDNNILIGYTTASSLTTGSNNIVMGFSIELPAATSSNMLDIGNLIYATGLTSTGTTVSTGNVGIGTPTPQKRTHISANSTTSQLRLERTGTSVGYSDIGSDNIGLRIFAGGDDGTPEVTITTGGTMLINKTATTNSWAKLDVNGGVRADSIFVNTSGADFVFDQNYKLASIEEVENYVLKNKHLSEIPSAQEMQKEGISVGNLQTKLLQKVEELTMYVIQLNKENKELKNKLDGKH